MNYCLLFYHTTVAITSYGILRGIFFKYGLIEKPYPCEIHTVSVLADRKFIESIGSHELHRISPLLSINSSILKTFSPMISLQICMCSESNRNFVCVTLQNITRLTRMTYESILQFTMISVRANPSQIDMAVVDDDDDDFHGFSVILPISVSERAI